MYRLAADTDLSLDRLEYFINEHRKEVTHRFEPLHKAYMTDYEILHGNAKDSWKPDNRIAVNFAKYITDTMNGFFIGIPIKIHSSDNAVAEYIETLDRYNGQDDNNAELSKLCSIFGKGYEMYFVDEDGQIGITYVSPMNAFMIYDDSVLERERFFVRIYIDENKKMHGSVSNEYGVRHFNQLEGLKWEEDDWQPHGFDGIPATEFKENAERMGIFEPVLTMINAYNKAISEKANDVDYFADAYLKILGSELDEEGVKKIRSNRIINAHGQNADKIVVEFLDKPDADTTQENLIERLEKLIYQISMVANISDENFGNTTGVALKYKLQAMSNLAKTKERKFTAGMNRRYRLIFSNPVSRMAADSWVSIEYTFTQNLPANLLEESQIAQNLSGITSQETQLKVISAVEDVAGEIKKLEEENRIPQFTETAFGGDE